MLTLVFNDCQTYSFTWKEEFAGFVNKILRQKFEFKTVVIEYEGSSTHGLITNKGRCEQLKNP